MKTFLWQKKIVEQIEHWNPNKYESNFIYNKS
jgi:hypothetical protein